MKTVVLALGWLVGFFAIACFFCWLTGLVLHMGSYNGADPGCGLVAHIPKGIFPLSFLLLLGRTKRLKSLLKKLEGCIDTGKGRVHPYDLEEEKEIKFWQR
jgi:hypothetical protein